MYWYKFLIYFALFAGALLNLANDILTLSDMHYGGEPERIGCIWCLKSSSAYIPIIMSIVMMIVNMLYFKKHAYLFVN